jgi:hypothetical protein
MARHAAAPDGAATVKVTVRVTDSVAAAWRAAAAAAGLTTSDWLRAQVQLAAAAGGSGSAMAPDTTMGLVGRRPPRRRGRGMGVAVPPPVDPAVVAQLVRIGNNLNQIARSRNALGLPLDAVCRVQLVGIARELHEVLATGRLGADADRGR